MKLKDTVTNTGVAVGQKKGKTKLWVMNDLEWIEVDAENKLVGLPIREIPARDYAGGDNFHKTSILWLET